MTERLIADKPVGGKKNPSNAKCLPFSRIASPEAILRAQRHVEHSIATLRRRLSYELITRLGQCPCCGRASAKQLLRHSKTREALQNPSRPAHPGFGKVCGVANPCDIARYRCSLCHASFAEPERADPRRVLQRLLSAGTPADSPPEDFFRKRHNASARR
jgi:hypothetical protein